MLRPVLALALISACVDPDQIARYEGVLAPEMETLVAMALERNIEDPEVDTLLADQLLAATLKAHASTLHRELSPEEKARVQASLIARSPEKKLALAARAAGYARHPLVAAKLVAALENDALGKQPPSKEALRAAFADQLGHFDPTKYHDRASLSARMHPDLIWVRVWETKNKALAGAIPTLPNKPVARDVGPVAKFSTLLPPAVIDDAFAIAKPEGFSKPIALEQKFYVVQRVTKVPATAFAEVEEQLKKIVNERRRPAIRRELLNAGK